MPRKTFLNGYPLPASDLNTYLMDQSVQTYADATARTAALATPVEGQMSYLADTNTAYVYDGSSWNAVVDAKNYGTVLPNGAAGRNKIINGAFDNWQRGTSVTNPGVFTYLADRWMTTGNGTVASVASRQTFTPGTAPVAGYEAAYFLRWAISSASGSSIAVVHQRIEDVRTFAGQTITVSFWAKFDASRTLTISARQEFGSGGSTDVSTSFAAQSVTSSWARYSATITLPSIAGKTIGTNSFLELNIGVPVNTALTLDLWGVQLEAGSVATPFSRAGGTLQGELAACQRYYQRFTAGGAYSWFRVSGGAVSTTQVYGDTPAIVTMRTSPTSVDFSSNLRLINYNETSIQNITNITINSNGSSPNSFSTNLYVSSGLTSGTAYRLQSDGSTSSYIGFPAEL